MKYNYEVNPIILRCKNEITNDSYWGNYYSQSPGEPMTEFWAQSIRSPRRGPISHDTTIEIHGDRRSREICRGERGSRKIRDPHKYTPTAFVFL
jgi:hypothetical protein